MAPEREPDIPRENPQEMSRRAPKQAHQAVSGRAASQRRSLGEDLYLRIHGIEQKKKQLENARIAIEDALKYIQSKPEIKKTLDRYKISLKPRDYYLAIAFKESSLNPNSVSTSDAKGLFQIKTKQGFALDDVNQTYGLNFTENDMFYNGTDESKQKQASIYNAVTGILYWHICRDIFRQKKNLKIKEEDRDRAAAFAFKIGPSAFANLWATIKPKNFNNFQIKLAGKLAKRFYRHIERPRKKVEEKTDETYGIGYPRYLQVIRPLPKPAKIRIGSRDYDAEDLIGTMRYCEIIRKLQEDSARVRQPEIVRQPASVKQPEGTQGKDYEIIKPPDQWMWSIATKVLEKCQKKYKIPYFLDPTKSITHKTRLLIAILIAYNKDEKKNPAFEGVDPYDSDPDVDVGGIVYFPPESYVKKTIKKFTQAAPPAKRETLPQGIPMYAGPDAARLERQGREILTYSGAQPPIPFSIPSYQGRPLDPNQPTPHGEMRKTDVKYIIIHGTEGIQGPTSRLYRRQMAHYLVRQNGTVELIRNEWVRRSGDRRVALDHAGIWGNMKRTPNDDRGAMAFWGGDQDISLHSIGIEVETPDHGTANTTQYRVLKQLIHWIGSRYSIPRSNVLGHSQIGVVDLLKFTNPGAPQRDRFRRGRKQDLRSIDWARLGLPDNYRRVDSDVARGIIGSHLERIEAGIICQRNGQGNLIDENWCGGTSRGMITGLKEAEKIYQQRKKQGTR